MKKTSDDKGLGASAKRRPRSSGVPSARKPTASRPSDRLRARAQGPFKLGDKVRALMHHGGSFAWEGKEFTVVSCVPNKHYGGKWAVTVSPHITGMGATVFGASWFELVPQPGDHPPMYAVRWNALIDQVQKIVRRCMMLPEERRRIIGDLDALRDPAALGIGGAAKGRSAAKRRTGAKRTTAKPDGRKAGTPKKK